MEQFVNLIQWKFRVVPFNYHNFCILGKQILYFVLWMFRNQHIEGGIPGHMYHNKCTVFGCQAYCKHNTKAHQTLSFAFFVLPWCFPLETAQCLCFQNICTDDFSSFLVCKPVLLGPCHKLMRWHLQLNISHSHTHLFAKQHLEI